MGGESCVRERGTLQLKNKWSLWDAKTKKRVKKENQRLRSYINELKNVPCADCGKSFPSEAMDFDHVPGRGGKLGSVPSMKSYRAISIEARKCDVVCAVCHRVRTASRRHDTRANRKERENWLDGVAEAVEREREAMKKILERDGL